MNKKHFVSAFSMIEAIVGMAVTAIIIGIVFVVFSILTEQMMDFRNQNAIVNDLNRLTYTINKDIFENEKMNLIENEIVFESYSGELVKYSINEDYLLRVKETFIDTFKIEIKQIKIDSVKSENQKLIFRKLSLDMTVDKKTMDLNFYKRVYANELLQEIKK